MKYIFLLLLFIVFSTSHVKSQKLHIKTKTGTDHYDIMDIDSLEVLRIEVDAPVIYSLNPNWGEIGDTIRINGKNFLAKDTIATTYLLFDNNKIESLTWNDSLIMMKIPENSKSGIIKVIVRSKASNEVELIIVEHKETPVIDYIKPTSAEAGATIQIEGEHFGKNQWEVYFEDIEVKEYLSWSDTLIVLKVPEDAVSGMVYVKREGIKSNSRFFEIIRIPKITRIAPTIGFIGDTVNIYGENFFDLRWANEVYFNNARVQDYVYWSNTKIKVIVPSGATTGKVKLRIEGELVEGGIFTILGKPYITRIRPIAGYIGDTVDIYGIHFGKEMSFGKIYFNGIKVVSYLKWSDNHLQLLVPEGAKTGAIQGDIEEILTNKVNFEVLDLKTVCDDCIDAEGNKYKTIKIGKQCWMAENLNTGKQIYSTELPANNKIIEKFCYNDSTENCDKWGGLYSLREALDWDTTEVGQGICPEGWRISNDNDWLKLEDGIESKGLNIGEEILPGGSTGFDALYGGDYIFRSQKYYRGDDWMLIWSPFIKDYKLVRRSRRLQSWYNHYLREDSILNHDLAYSVRCIKVIKPVVDSIYPKVLEYGDRLVIFGKFFGKSKNDGALYINNTKVTDIIKWKETEIEIKITDKVISGGLRVWRNSQCSEEQKILIN